MQNPARSISPVVAEGPAPMACIHGFLETGAMWRGLPRRCLDGLNAISLTLPGHDPSLPLPYDLDALADFHAERLRHAFPGRRVRLVGHSTGALAALSLALRHPDLVEDGFLIAPLFSGRIRASGVLARVLRLPVLGPRGFAWMVGRWLTDATSFEAGMRAVMAPGARIGRRARDAMTEMHHDMRRCDIAELYRAGSWIATQDLTDRLGDLQVPMQAMLCQHDPVVAVAHQMQLVSAAPQVDAVLIGTGHQPQIEAPRAFAGLFRAWRLRQPPRISDPASSPRAGTVRQGAAEPA